PEQFLGQTDHRSDIFSIGAVCYELLTYVPAFGGDAPAVMHKIFLERPASLTSRCPGIDRRLAKTVHRALAKKPPRRHKDLHELRADLKRVGAGPRVAEVLQITEPPPPWYRRGPKVLLGAGVVTLMSVAWLWLVLGAYMARSASARNSPTGSVQTAASPK